LKTTRKGHSNSNHWNCRNHRKVRSSNIWSCMIKVALKIKSGSRSSRRSISWGM